METQKYFQLERLMVLHLAYLTVIFLVLLTPSNWEVKLVV